MARFATCILLCMPLIDLRSDTVTKPTPGMREAIARAVVGDDVLGDDPTVIELQERFAALTGKDAACFVPSSTMANQICIKALTQPGDEIIAHEGSHIINYEGGGPAVLSGCMVKALTGNRGQFTAGQVEESIRPDDPHFPRTSLVSLENTHNRGGGSVWAIEEIRSVTSAARDRGLKTHLDGARLWNACVATGLSVRDYAEHFDTVSCCFSKGLGAPVGAVLACDRKTIHKVLRYRKLFGGGMRQSGLLAAACIYAMEHHFKRLEEDHANARRFAERIVKVPGFALSAQHGTPAGVDTNIVLFELSASVAFDGAELCKRAAAKGVLMFDTGPRRVRVVTSLEVDAGKVDRAVEVIGECVKG